MQHYTKLDPSTATAEELVLCAMAIESAMTAEEKTDFLIKSFIIILQGSKNADQKGEESAESLLGSLMAAHFCDTLKNLQSDKILIKEKPQTKN